MNQILWSHYTELLKRELVPALGCTEPIAIALAAAKARALLGVMPETLIVRCSGNVLKNAKSVVVPTSENLRGVSAAALLGAVGGDADAGLEVLKQIQPEHLALVRNRLETNCCQVAKLDTAALLHIRVEAHAGAHQAVCEIRDSHTHVVRLERDGEVLLHVEASAKGTPAADGFEALELSSIWDYCHQVPLEDIREVLERQISYNTAISQEGLRGEYGAGIGRTLLAMAPSDLRTRARAVAAAGSDARMGGCVLPVVINSGSGNQGMTVCLPVVEYAGSLQSSPEALLRALAFANLVALLQKREIGRLSAFCGAVSAGCGAGAGIAYLEGATLAVIRAAIINTLGNVGGIVCDGAKASCAAKIASAVDAALLGYETAKAGRGFLPGEGLVKATAEETIVSVGRMAREGMQTTDQVILELMLA